jgi:redox-sensing transcriptional repressor
LVAAGIRGILNFAPTVVRLPEGVSLVSVDLAVQLEQLAFLVQLNQGSEKPDAEKPGGEGALDTP